MILINLLPPELRRRGGGISPVFASMLGGGVVNGLLLLFFLWIQFVRLPAARDELAARDSELQTKTVLADAVTARKNQIAEFEQRRDAVLSLLASKMFLARNLDDFANLVTGAFEATAANGNLLPLADLQVRALDLQVKEVSGTGEKGPSKGQDVLYSFKWKYQILGQDQNRGGDYIKAFFETVQRSPFWRGYGKDSFLGKPEDPYLGDKPEWVTDIQRLVIEGSLEWRRRKPILYAPVKVKSAMIERVAPLDGPLLALRTER